MPRPTRARRFEPRFGVSREMLAIEAKEVERELRSYLRLSTEDLQSRLNERKTKGSAASDAVRQYLSAIPERERLALQCLLVRDGYHLLELYLTYLNAHHTGPDSAPKAATTAPSLELPFSEWLFDRVTQT